MRKMHLQDSLISISPSISQPHFDKLHCVLLNSTSSPPIKLASLALPYLMQHGNVNLIITSVETAAAIADGSAFVTVSGFCNCTSCCCKSDSAHFVSVAVEEEEEKEVVVRM
jgi:hypothetical protein